MPFVPAALPHGHLVRLDYHQRLIADPHRMVAYQRAIERLVEPGMVVLDAGAGTGVLAMMAARAGASRVYAVESMAIAELAAENIRRNGLSDIVELVRADLRTLAPLAAVDLVVSDCLGRFLVDDQMLDAMDAAAGWLAPHGRVAPRRVSLMVAPVMAGHLDLVDTCRDPVLGLDLTALGEAIGEGTWAGAFPMSALLAEPALFATWDLPGPLPSFERELSFSLAPGRLVGLAGWFRAELTDGVLLETGPGFETHWHQAFWPLPACRVAGGDRLELRLELVDSGGRAGGEPLWRRQGRVLFGERDGRVGTGAKDFDLGAPGTKVDDVATTTAPTSSPGTQDAEALDARGAELFEAGDLAGARALFEAAVARPGRHGPDLWDNLGIARFMTGEPVLAIAPLLRALEGDPGSREQTLRLLVSACFQSGRSADGERYLALYEARFGPHPLRG